MRKPLYLLILLSACGGFAPTIDGQTPAAAATQAPDDSAYLTVQHALENGRGRFLNKDAIGIVTAGHWVYYKTYPGLAGVLHRQRTDGSQATDYAFSIGGGDDENVAVS